MLQLILFSPDSIVPSGAALLSSICILPVFYVYSTPNETQPLVTRVSRDRLLKIYNTPCTFRAPKARGGYNAGL